MARVFSMYREAEGLFAVPVDEARMIATRSLLILGRRLGMVSMTAIRPLVIDHVINPYDLGMEPIRGGGAHNVVITRRLQPTVDDPTEGHRHGSAYLALDAGEIIASQSVISVAPPEAAPYQVASARMVHQLTHTYGVDHCADESCIMQPCDLPSDERLATMAMAANPYCLDHHELMGQIAARMALDDYQ